MLSLGNTVTHIHLQRSDRLPRTAQIEDVPKSPPIARKFESWPMLSIFGFQNAEKPNHVTLRPQHDPQQRRRRLKCRRGTGIVG